MATMNQVHDSSTCRLGPGAGPCTMCVWAIQRERKQAVERSYWLMSELHRLSQTERTKVIDAAIDATNAEVRICGDVLTTFDDDWELAPLSRTRCVEKSDAEWWYRMGQRAKEREMLVLQNEDYREMLRVGRERVER